MKTTVLFRNSIAAGKPKLSGKPYWLFWLCMWVGKNKGWSKHKNGTSILCLFKKPMEIRNSRIEIVKVFPS